MSDEPTAAASTRASSGIGCNIVLFSPYHSGSHRDWAEGYQNHSRHKIKILSLPGRFWKWRMHGGAISLARQFREISQAYPLWITTDMLDLTILRALVPPEKWAPCVLYMHENQLTYPLPEDPDTGPMRRQKGERDMHYVFINYSSMLAATEIWFNSQFHYQSWFESLPRFLRHFPDENLPATLAEIKGKSRVVPVGIQTFPGRPAEESGTCPIILWNHRWEFDKNPELFFDTILKLANDGIDFEISVCGENFERKPARFERAREQLGACIRHWGYASKQVYGHLLRESDLVVSTAHHDFFGISVAEASAAACLPILPRRLAYPELIPASFHPHCLYDTKDELEITLRKRLLDLPRTRQLARELAPHMERFSWKQMASEYDRHVERILGGVGE